MQPDNEATLTGNDLYDYYKGVEQTRVILLFKGAVSQNTLVSLGDLVRLPPEEGGQEGYNKRLFAIMVEMAQNILHYSLEREPVAGGGSESGVGMLVVQQLTGLFRIASGNLVRSEQKEKIEAICLHINSLTQEQLREYYVQQRKKAVHEDAKGAGLGFIDIARKARNPLGYHFRAVTDNSWFFSLSAQIDRETPTLA